MRIFKDWVITAYRSDVHELIEKPPKATCLHPEFRKLIEYGFTCEGKKYYRMKNTIDLPIRRWHKVEEFIRHAEMRITRKDLVEILDLCIDKANQGKLTDMVMLINSIKHLTEMFIETDTYYDLFSAMFFDEDEIIEEYDYDYNKAKIEAFKRQPPDAFFLQEPLRTLMPFQNISGSDILTYSKATEDRKKSVEKIKYDSTKNS